MRLEPLRTAHSEALVVGTTRFYEIVTADRRVAIGYTWLSQSAQRTAINTEAKLLMLTHAFEHREWAKQQGRWQLVGAHVSQVKNM